METKEGRHLTGSGPHLPATLNPLGSLTQLSQLVYLSRPSTGPLARTLIICTWMNASKRNIAKYISGYEALDRRLRIVLITNSSSDAFRLPSKVKKILTPAVDAIRASNEDSYAVHIFSNGGAVAFCTLASLYRAETGRPLPVRNMLLDSSPGRATISGAVRAFSASLPRSLFIRLPAKGLLYALMSTIWLLFKIVRRPDPISDMRLDLNNSKLIDQSGRRTYVYSEPDELVDWRDIEDHIKDSDRAGRDVRREKFVGSDHVGHVRVDAQRYWRIVQDNLDASSSPHV